MFPYASVDPWGSLRNALIMLVVIAAIAAIVVWRGRRSGSRTITLDLALTISGWWVVLSAIGVVMIMVKVLTSDWAEIGGSALQLPWPEQLPCNDTGDSSEPMLSCSVLSAKYATVSPASLELRLLSGAAQVVNLALSTVPAAMVAVICFQTLKGRPFSRTATRNLAAGAVAVLVLGVANDLLPGVTATVGLREVFPPDSEWYPSDYYLFVTPLPFAAALALAALAAVFHQGMRLQREKEQLQRETEGLV
ncbi:hypothetical protein [Microbacterium sp. LWH12-1.2]|uniref:hypothetical protein n=1 Tax=Microbacterium sp. LWH12-1.2 TaxID=3135259 RepID=UPI00343BF80A